MLKSQGKKGSRSSSMPHLLYRRTKKRETLTIKGKKHESGRVRNPKRGNNWRLNLKVEPKSSREITNCKRRDLTERRRSIVRKKGEKTRHAAKTGLLSSLLYGGKR